MRFVAAVLMLSLALPGLACEKPSPSSGGETPESILARTVFNRITPESLEIDAAAKNAYGCRYIFADVSGGLERAKPKAGGLPKAPIGSDGQPKAGKVLIAYIITADGVAADPVVLESTDGQLTETALQAMQAWRFQPASFNGRAVASLAAQEFPFAATGP
jgi:TonB family protein